MKKLKKLFAIALILISCSLFSQEILVKKIGIDSVTGLEVQARVWKVIIDAKIETIQVEYDLEYLSPKGIVVKSVPSAYTRFNQPAQLDSEGVEIVPAKMKFNELRNSSIGQGITFIITDTFKSYPNLAQ